MTTIGVDRAVRAEGEPLSILVFFILATNLTLLYFAFEISRRLRAIAEQLDDRSSRQDPILRMCADEPPPQFLSSFFRYSAIRISLPRRGPAPKLSHSLHREGDAGRISHGKGISAKHCGDTVGQVRYYVIWCWSGGSWVPEKHSVPAGCETGPPPQFAGNFPGQYVKTEVIARCP